MFNLTSWLLYFQGRTLVHFEWRLGGPQSWSEHLGTENDLLPLLGFGPQIIKPVA